MHLYIEIRRQHFSLCLTILKCTCDRDIEAKKTRDTIRDIQKIQKGSFEVQKRSTRIIACAWTDVLTNMS